jgi:hypothetical protein
MMSKLFRMATPLIAVAIMSSVPFMTLAQNSQTGNATKSTATPAATEEWNTPPAGTEQAQQGFRDGVEGAMLDTLAKRKIGATTSFRYMHPPVKGIGIYAYRSGFEAGYAAQLKHAANS